MGRVGTLKMLTDEMLSSRFYALCERTAMRNRAEALGALLIFWRAVHADGKSSGSPDELRALLPGDAARQQALFDTLRQTGYLSPDERSPGRYLIIRNGVQGSTAPQVRARTRPAPEPQVTPRPRRIRRTRAQMLASQVQKAEAAARSAAAAAATPPPPAADGAAADKACTSTQTLRLPGLPGPKTTPAALAARFGAKLSPMHIDEMQVTFELLGEILADHGGCAQLSDALARDIFKALRKKGLGQTHKLLRYYYTLHEPCAADAQASVLQHFVQNLDRYDTMMRQAELALLERLPQPPAPRRAGYG